MKRIISGSAVVLTISSLLLFSSTFIAFASPQDGNHTGPIKPGRDPNQPIDEEYTQKIREYTTEKFFSSPLVDYLPASKSVPTPKVVLGDVAGAANCLIRTRSTSTCECSKKPPRGLRSTRSELQKKDGR